MNRYWILLMTLPVILLVPGCNRSAESDTEQLAEPVAELLSEAAEKPKSPDFLAAILDAQAVDKQVRYPYRNPKETLAFFGIEPGMTVVEVLPGGGWYSTILIPYLGDEGHLIGINYPLDMWPKFGKFDDEAIERLRTWTNDWPEQMREQLQAMVDANDELTADAATVSAFEFGSLPADLEGQADAVLFIRAMHNLARFEGDGAYLSTALDETFRLLKSGGIVGIVQHEARPDMPDEWASGARGYVKRKFVLDRMREAGFEFIEASSINENPADQPNEEDFVWRLPPTLATSREDPELRARMEAIGESHRMTLKFRKP